MQQSDAGELHVNELVRSDEDPVPGDRLADAVAPTWALGHDSVVKEAVIRQHNCTTTRDGDIFHSPPCFNATSGVDLPAPAMDNVPHKIAPHPQCDAGHKHQ